MDDACPEPRWLIRLTWAFVALGVLLRVGRYAMNFPLWWDEAFVGVNLLNRGYLDLLRPLDYGQVCPLSFLWIELAAVKCFGFSEWSLRLFPLICGVLGVILFRHTSGLILRGLPRLLATALFAVSFYPIRHSADVKPYASDLLASLVLITLALHWVRRRDPVWLWAMAVFGPIAVSLSYPAIFVAGGIGLALLPSTWIAGRTSRISLAVFGLLTIATFMALFAIFTQEQAGSTLPAMQAEWADSFPPWKQPWRLVIWFANTHTGDLFAYPFGASRAASTLIFVAVLIASVALSQLHQRTVVAICLFPFALGMLAAAMHRYPYGGSAHGGSARFMQYLAPSICLLAGVGASVALGWVRSPHRRFRLLSTSLVGLAAAGIVPVLIDLPHPYRAIQAQKSRQFAREFWPKVGKVQSLRGEVSVAPWESIHLNVPVAICNQAIYSPYYHRDQDPSLTPQSYVLVDAHPEEQAHLDSWLTTMRQHHTLIHSETIVVDVGELRGRKVEETYEIFEFVPKIAVASRPARK